MGKLQIVKGQLAKARREAKQAKPQHAAAVAAGAAVHGALLGATDDDPRAGIVAGLAATAYGYARNSPRVMMAGVGLLSPEISNATRKIVASQKAKMQS